jgi:hypothetical protein
LYLALAKTLSELPKETVLHCWAPLQASFDNMDALHAKASEQLVRLFPNMATYVPDGEEEEPSSDADDDYVEPAPKQARAQRTRAEAERAEHARAADVAVASGVLVVSLRSGHPAPPLPPQMQQWMLWVRVASLCERSPSRRAPVLGDWTACVNVHPRGREANFSVA